MPSFADRDGQIWLNGSLVPWREAQIHVLTHSLHYAGAVFEGERAYNGRVFKEDEHHARLKESAQLLGYNIPYSVSEITQAVKDVLSVNHLSDAYIRPIAWRGSEQMGLHAKGNAINLAIAAWDWPSYFSAEVKQKGLRLSRATYRRPSPQTAPTASKCSGLYMIGQISKTEAENRGFDEALMLTYDGRVAETSSSNIFFVQDGRLITPRPDCFLDGITRRTVIDIARELGYEVTERDIMPEELPQMEEAFLAGTAVEVTPVGGVEEIVYKPGDITWAIMDAYGRLTQGQENNSRQDASINASASAA